MSRENRVSRAGEYRLAKTGKHETRAEGVRCTCDHLEKKYAKRIAVNFRTKVNLGRRCQIARLWRHVVLCSDGSVEECASRWLGNAQVTDLHYTIFTELQCWSVGERERECVRERESNKE